MKVLLIAENWSPRVGGIENYLSSIVSHLPAGTITVIAPLHPDAAYAAGVFHKRFFWPLIKPSWWPLWLSIKKLAKREKFDIVLCGKALLEGQLGRRLQKKLGIPYIIFTYAMEIETWKHQSLNRRKLLPVLHDANRVVYINEQTKKSLVDLGVTEEQLVKIWPGIDDHFLEDVSVDTREAVLKKYGITKPYVFTLSRLIYRKGTDLLIEAFTSLQATDIQLVIAGGGPERENLEIKVKELGLSKKVHFLGVVPDEDLPALFTGAHVFALPPRNDARDMEGFGIVYLQAAAKGVPVVATLVGGVPEAVIHNQTGILVQPDNVQAIAEALRLLLTDENMRKTFGETAKKRAYDEFRWSKRIMLVKGMIDAVLH